MAQEVIHIEWEGPYCLQEVRDKFKNYEEDCGLYQIYGHHPVYGPEVLLYIGKTTENSFSGRMKEHEEWLLDLELPHNLKICLERINDVADEQWQEAVNKAEALLIYSHWPAGNSSAINDIDEEIFYDVHILNWGEFGSLLPEVSGDRWTNKHDRKETIYIN